MKLTVYPSNKGDCLLLTSKNDKRVLIDGGMASSYRRYVSPALARLQAAGGKIDVVYVSHIDEDHISGILELANESFLWKVFDIHAAQGIDKGTGNATDGFKKPTTVLRPPAVEKIWYNAFAAIVPQADGPVQSVLIEAATAFAASEKDSLRAAALELRDLVTSVPQGIELTNRLGSKQLNWKLNPNHDGGLMYIERGKKASLKKSRVGSMTFFPIGPFKEDLDRLKKDWDDWIDSHKAKVKELEAERRADERRLTTNEFERLRRELLALSDQLGDRRNVTPPNLASLMFLVEEDGASLLLTGDGHGQDVLNGLTEWGKLDNNGLLHVNVLKVQHHGSEHNLDPEFCRRITADHYVFCANGAHENPDLRILKAIVDSRIGPADLRSPNPRAEGKFTFWFNSSSTFEDNTNHDNVEHMKLVEADVRRYVTASNGRMAASYITDPPWSDEKESGTQGGVTNWPS